MCQVSMEKDPSLLQIQVAERPTNGPVRQSHGVLQLFVTKHQQDADEKWQSQDGQVSASF